jgi:prepilin-type N-terminal cleavage/methylation domain-containing protein
VLSRRTIPGRAFSPKQRARTAFTLIEMLVVMVVIAILAVLIVPAFNTIKGASLVTNAAFTVKDTFDQARAYARSNNTYVWVGFYEEDALNGGPGSGRVIISTVASKDGSQILNLGTSAEIDPTKLLQIGKLTKIEQIHLGDIPFPSNPDDSGSKSSWNERPNVKTTYVTYRIGETTPNPTSYPFRYPVGNAAPSAKYTFKKTIEFSPIGEVFLNSSYSMRPWIEVGIQPTHGNVKDTNSANVAAVQVSGAVGAITVFRK